MDSLAAYHLSLFPLQPSHSFAEHDGFHDAEPLVVWADGFLDIVPWMAAEIEKEMQSPLRT